MELLHPWDIGIIAHTRQPEKYGCLCCAFYACTNDKRFLQHITETQVSRISAFASTYGFTVYDWWNGAGLVKFPKEILDRYLANASNDFRWHFVLTIPSQTRVGGLHTVGSVFFKREDDGPLFVCISDSQKDQLQVYEYEEFCSSNYGVILEMFVIEKTKDLLEVPAMKEHEVIALLEQKRYDQGGQVPHQAAVVFYQDQIIVSDSLRSNFDVIKSHEHFFESQYAKAFYVAHILTASIDKYPHENAAEMFELEFGKGVDL
jgi:hypothetical protein